MRRTSFRLTLLSALALFGCDDDGGGKDQLDAQLRDDAGDHDAGSNTAIEAGPDNVRDAGGGGGEDPFVCNVVAPTSCPTPMPRYADIAPIIAKRCSICHGQDWTGEWPLDSYSHVADWQDEIRSELVTCAMPPPDAGVPIPLDERMKILTWVRCGAPK